jgi:uncharacterized protein
MSLTNRERVGKGLEVLREGLKPFVEREIEAAYPQRWEELMRQVLSSAAYRAHEPLNLDTQALLKLMWGLWQEVFQQTLGRAERSIVSELVNVRNDWAHDRAFASNDAHRALDSMHRLLTAISAKNEAAKLDELRHDLLRIMFEEQARSQKRKLATLEAGFSAGLQPWRMVVTPHPDVASGRFSQAEFAADLGAVHDEVRAVAPEYKEPRQFFARTFLTQGLRTLLKNGLRRLTGKGDGDPVIQLQTNFGGGKTHAMLALYHLFSGESAADLPGVEELLRELGLPLTLPTVRRAVLVGTHLTPASAMGHLDGTEARTLWGEMAWQLGGAAGYGMVAESDRTGTSPGTAVLHDLLVRFSPCLILIDEWVAYLRQLHNKTDLPAGSLDANLTFAQALTEAVKRVPQALLVASLPASDIEVGGEGGRLALARLQHTFSRVEASWRPASTEEGFEIVRRRLFQPLPAQGYVARDTVIKAFTEFYATHANEFPLEAKERAYAERMKAAYPIHPELFDRLYNDWSALEKFQRTRGVLRLMAAVIYTLWERQESGLLIMPCHMPMDAPMVREELTTRYLEENWLPVIEKDVDSGQALPLEIDRQNPNLARYSATRRVARTIYMGSAPRAQGNNLGLDERNIKLGCAQPGESPATFGDALRRLMQQATHYMATKAGIGLAPTPRSHGWRGIGQVIMGKRWYGRR